MNRKFKTNNKADYNMIGIVGLLIQVFLIYTISILPVSDIIKVLLSIGAIYLSIHIITGGNSSWKFNVIATIVYTGFLALLATLKIYCS